MNNLVIACGALAFEIQQIKKTYNLNFDTICLNANLHNQPKKIPQQVEELILRMKKEGKYKSIFIAYADCGTGNQLKKVAKKYNLEMLEGAHCYQFYTKDKFLELAEQEPGTFYLTDFLAKNFKRLIIKELGLIENPELKDIYFKNYKKLVYLIQNESFSHKEKAQEAAEFLGLSYYELFTGNGYLEDFLVNFTGTK